MTLVKSFDQSFSPITDYAAAYADGYRVLMQYAGTSSSKNITPAIIAEWFAQGDDAGILALFESTAGRALTAGRAGGTQDAQAARKAWRALGYPDTCPIIYAVDVNVTPAQIAGPVAEYFAGIDAGDTCLPWAYIENDGIKKLVSVGLIAHGFQPAAWGWGEPATPGAWDVNAWARQEHNGVNAYGGNIDTGEVDDRAPIWFGETVITDQDKADIAAAVWAQYLGHSGPTAGIAEQTGFADIQAIQAELDVVKAQAAANGGNLSTLIAKVDALAASSTPAGSVTLDPATVAAIAQAVNDAQLAREEAGKAAGK